MDPIFVGHRSADQRRPKLSASTLTWTGRFAVVLFVHLLLVGLFWAVSEWRESNDPLALNIELVTSGAEVLDAALIDAPESVPEPSAERLNQMTQQSASMPFAKESRSVAPPEPTPTLEPTPKPTPQPQPTKAKQAQSQQPRPATQPIAVAAAPMASPDVGPKPTSSPKPPYPLTAFKAKQEGKVVLELEVLEDGAVGQVRLAQSSTVESLDESALATVKKWKYSPAQKGGQIVKQWIRVSILFEVKSR
jgi:protein TonB